MGCCSCKYLCDVNRKKGRCNGALYYCKSKKCYVNGKGGCDNYYKDYSRSSSTIHQIYHDGVLFYDDNKEPGDYLIILIIMIILAIIVNLLQ